LGAAAHEPAVVVRRFGDEQVTTAVLGPTPALPKQPSGLLESEQVREMISTDKGALTSIIYCSNGQTLFILPLRPTQSVNEYIH
jgi:hypothetical protein